MLSAGPWWWLLVTCQLSQSRGTFRARCVPFFIPVTWSQIDKHASFLIVPLLLGCTDGGCRVLGAGRPWEDSSRAAANCKFVCSARLFFFFGEHILTWSIRNNITSCFFVFQPMMDRNHADELPKMQCGFIDFVCSFVYKVSIYCTSLLANVSFSCNCITFSV